jgi:hypothetical protein
VTGEHSAPEPAPTRDPGWWAHLGDTEPVRRALYPVAAAVVALLVGYGVLSDATAVLWLGLAAAVLIPVGTEVARSAAWAPGSVDDRDLDWYARLDRWRDYEYERGLADAAVALDEPGEHAAPEPPELPTQQIPAIRPRPKPPGM